MARSLDQTKRARLVAATRTLLLQGTMDPLVQDIATSAGVAKGTFYLYFASRDDVIAEVISDHFRDVACSLEALVDRTDLTSSQKLSRLFLKALEVPDSPETVDLVAAIHVEGQRRVHDLVTRRFAELLRPPLTRLLEQGVACGAFRIDDPGRVAQFIMSAVVSLEDYGLDPTSADVAEWCDSFTTFCLHGVGSGDAAPAGGGGCGTQAG